MTSPATVPLNDLSRAVVAQRSALDGATRRVLDSGWFILGPENLALEAELAVRAQVDHAVLVANGTDALQLSLAAVGVGPGSVVQTVANAGGYTTAAALALGAVLSYVDTDPETLLADLAETQRAADRDGRLPDAIVVTHLYGAAAPVDDIVHWARERGIPVVEDVAQAFGGSLGGRPLGSLGDVGTTSFYPTKNLGALGDGGAVLTSDPAIADTVRRLRQYGWSAKYTVADERGRNSRMDELQAAIVRARLPLLDDVTARRRAIHGRYVTAASGTATRVIGELREDFVAHLAVLVVEDRDRARAHFHDHGVATDIHYPVPDHRQPAASTPQPSLPVTERFADRILSVPLFPELTDDEVDRVAAAIATLPA